MRPPMPEVSHHLSNSDLAQIEPNDRLVVLARTLQANGSKAETVLRDGALNWGRFGDRCLGQALYRHRSVFQSTSDAPVWSHLELSYFRHVAPAEVIQELVVNGPPEGVCLLRAEILLTTPSSFMLPDDWQGSAEQPERLASLEYIQVQPRHLREYRNAMQDYCGVAAMKLVRANRFGTFRAMETAAVLYRAPEMTIDWNQIHLCELNPDGFDGFGKEFAAVQRNDESNETGPSDAFTDLGRMRTVPRWTFNDFVVESDSAVGRFRTSS
jgi:hypothetical protein